MVLIALYFLLTIMIVPQFGDIERVYRLSRSSSTALHDQHLFQLFGLLGFGYCAGFTRTILSRR
jgi:hypothetical protein